jgi:hypothetical protein
MSGRRGAGSRLARDGFGHDARSKVLRWSISEKGLSSDPETL